MLALLASIAAFAGSPVQGGAGLFFNAGGSFMTQPNGGVTPYDLPYNGFAGYASGVGIALDGRVKDIVGLEIDFVHAKDHAESQFSINLADGSDATFDWSIDQPAWHVPILLKAGIPSPIVRPELFLGPEIVLPSDPVVNDPVAESGSYTWGIPLSAHSDSYTLFTFGFGFEFKLPIDPVDIRLPLTIRGSFNPSTPSEATERADYTVNGNDQVTAIDYLSEWQYHAAITAGVLVLFPH